MNTEQIKKAIKAAFEEGYASYATPCAAYNSVEEAWNESEAKDVYDNIGKSKL